MTLAELKTAMQDWAQSSETTFVADLNTMIVNAEKRIYNRVMVPDAKTSTTFATVSGTKSYSFTADCIQPLRVWLTVSGNDRAPMLRKAASYLREAFIGYTNAEPTYYAWLRSSATQPAFLLGPTPDAIYTVNVEYMDGTPPSLVSAENWLSTNYPEVLRKVAIHEASIFLKQWESAPLLKQEAEEAISSLAQIVGAPPKDEEKPQ